MARTIAEIKDAIASEFMKSETAANKYGFEKNSLFGAYFSKVSIENILFYTAAAAIWTLEVLMDNFRIEVDTRINEIIAHRPKWYRDKVLNFMENKTLETDSDVYDTSNMSEAQIEAAKIVKHAVAVESAETSILTIKVAGEKSGVRQPLSAAQENQLKAYIAEIKDAGVRINLVNISPDIFNCAVDIYYDPMLMPENVQDACTEAIKHYVENLPFNGTYSNMALIDTLQGVEGVKVAEFKSASSKEFGLDVTLDINGIKVPAAGYFTLGLVTLTAIAYEQ